MSDPTEALALRMRVLDRQIAAAQAEQAAIWRAIQQARGVGPAGLIGQVAAIVDAVADEFNVPRADILSARQSRTIAEARHAVAWLARHMTPMSYPAIARALNRDHTTVMHSVQAADLRIGRSGEFAHRIATLQAELARQFLEAAHLRNPPVHLLRSGEAA